MIPLAPLIAGVAGAVPGLIEAFPDIDPAKAGTRRIGALKNKIAKADGALAKTLRPARRKHLEAQRTGWAAELATLEGFAEAGPSEG